MRFLTLRVWSICCATDHEEMAGARDDSASSPAAMRDARISLERSMPAKTRSRFKSRI
jgi:hypothetical protein